jgi:hypothetical protein
MAFNWGGVDADVITTKSAISAIFVISKISVSSAFLSSANFAT